MSSGVRVSDDERLFLRGELLQLLEDVLLVLLGRAVEFFERESVRVEGMFKLCVDEPAFGFERLGEG